MDTIFSFRLLLFFGSLAGFTLYACYGASFAAFLSVPYRLIHKVQDLYAHEYTVYSHPTHTQYLDEFVEVKHEIYLKYNRYRSYHAWILQSQEEKQRILETSERVFVSLEHFLVGIAKSQSRQALILNPHALHAYGILSNISEDVLCELTVLRKDYGLVKGVMILRRGSPLRDLFNHRFISCLNILELLFRVKKNERNFSCCRTAALIERGFVDRCNKDYDRQTLVSCSFLDEANRYTVVAIEIAACIYQFGIFAIGAVLSFFIVALEIIFKSSENNNERYIASW